MSPVLLKAASNSLSVELSADMFFMNAKSLIRHTAENYLCFVINFVPTIFALVIIVASHSCTVVTLFGFF